MSVACAVDGCQKPRKGARRGLCSMHLARVDRTGITDLREYDYDAAVSRFWSKVDRRGPDECWPWLGVVLKASGYGQFSVRSQRWLAHRYVYELAVGPISAGLTIDHVKARGCAGRSCVNPAHLEVVTMAENLRRSEAVSSKNSRKTECPRCGGPYSFDRRGKRFCRPCRNAWRPREVGRRAS